MIQESKFIIIGGGIVGCSIAREIALRGLGSVILLEKESVLGCHASGRNSGVIHSGINQKPGTLKAKMCVEGSRLLREYCVKKSVPMHEGGTLVIARNDEELGVIEEVLDWGKQCGVEGLELLTRNQILKREPDAAGENALLSPRGATVDSLRLLQSIANDAEDQGVKIIFNTEVNRIEGNVVISQVGRYKADHIINCAGLYADKIAHMMGVGQDYFIVPFRGEYYEVVGPQVNSMIYQPPNLKFPFLSIHLTKEVDGRILAGPSAVISFGRESYDKEFNGSEVLEMVGKSNFQKLLCSKEFLGMAIKNYKTSLFQRCFIQEAEKLVSNGSFTSVCSANSGIRAQMVSKEGKLINELLIEEGKSSTHILNTISPGMTCSLAFANYIVDQLN